MPGKRHDLMTRGQLITDIRAYAAEAYDATKMADVIAQNLGRLTGATEDPAVVRATIAARAEVTKPAVPDDLDALSDAQLVQLADRLDAVQGDFFIERETARFVNRCLAGYARPLRADELDGLILSIGNTMRAGLGLRSKT